MLLHPDGTYAKADMRGKQPFGSQAAFCEEALLKKKSMMNDIKDTRVFIPETRPETPPDSAD